MVESLTIGQGLIGLDVIGLNVTAMAWRVRMILLSIHEELAESWVVTYHNSDSDPNEPICRDV